MNLMKSLLRSLGRVSVVGSLCGNFLVGIVMKQVCTPCTNAFTVSPKQKVVACDVLKPTDFFYFYGFDSIFKELSSYSNSWQEATKVS
jgi:hypothetical protein